MQKGGFCRLWMLGLYKAFSFIWLCPWIPLRPLPPGRRAPPSAPNDNFSLRLCILSCIYTPTPECDSLANHSPNWMQVICLTIYVLLRLIKNMSHVDQYGFRHHFGSNEGLLLHHLCQQLHEHYNARKTDNQQTMKRWKQLLTTSNNLQPLQFTLTNKVKQFVWQ